jgi:DNA-binding transcriptional ArsR family regulator
MVRSTGGERERRRSTREKGLTMVAIGLSAGSVARVRFTVSCLWEVVASLRVLREPARHAVHLPWVRRVRPRLVSERLIEHPASLLWRLTPGEARYVPDFLTPAATGLAPVLADELDTLRAVSAQTVRHDLAQLDGHSADTVRALHADPARGLRLLADQIDVYWRIAIEPEWPQIYALLEGDILSRARQLAQDGVADVLNGLHERVHWEEGTLSVMQPHCTAANLTDGGGLTLVPSVFVWPSVLTVTAGKPPQLAYPARGLARLWDGGRPSFDALGAVLGHSRARLLVEMSTPVSTTELARRTGLTAGSVSQHLTALRAAGLVSAHRHGRAVLNARTPVADTLVCSYPERRECGVEQAS